jgi:acyl carrier protein
MTRSEIDHGIAEILTIILHRQVHPQEEVYREGESNWNSLKHVELVLMLEEKFNLQLTEEQMTAIASSADIRTLVDKYAT